METELDSVGFVEKSGTKMNVWQTNGNLGCSKQVKIVEPTPLGGSPGGSAKPMGGHWDGKVVKWVEYGNDTYSDILKLKNVK